MLGWDCFETAFASMKHRMEAFVQHNKGHGSMVQSTTRIREAKPTAGYGCTIPRRRRRRSRRGGGGGRERERALMMEATLIPIVEKLGSLIVDEGRFISGVHGDVDWLGDELRSMQSFLEDAEAYTGGGRVIEMWVDQVRDLVYDSEDIIDIFDFSRRHGRLWSYACFIHQLKSRHQMGTRIKELRSKLEDIFRRKSEYKFELPRKRLGRSSDLSKKWLHGLASSPLFDEGEMIGVEKDLELLLGWVLDEGPELRVISLVGMGGLGKTTLIKKLYNHTKVRRHFHRSFWIYVSQSCKLHDLLSEMAKGLMEIPSSEVDVLSENQLQEMLLSSLGEKRYLIVFDDVWDKRLWNAIRPVLPKNEHGSRIIITTRNNEVASSVIDVQSYNHQLHPLSLEESWELFCKKVFVRDLECHCPDELQEVAEGIVKKCDGLPLAVVTIGGMMSRKEPTQWEWKHVFDNIYKDFRNDEDGIQQTLFLSYRDLPYKLKPCFLYFSIFPHDYVISRKRLIRLWVAEGLISEEAGELMEDAAEKYLMELINRSMIQVSKRGGSGRVKECRIHDLLHQLAISISEKEKFSAILEDPKTEITQKARRISLQKNFFGVAFSEGKFQSRSLSMFNISEPFRISHCMLWNFKLLRVLDLEDACLRKLSSKVGDLIHLRYLSLKGTKINTLPKSLKNLCNLKTLDIGRTNLRSLSFELRCLKEMRHLEMKQIGWSLKVLPGLGCLQKLQVVTGLQANKLIVYELQKLIQLKKLSIEDLRAEDTTPLCISINNMVNLSSLSIFSVEDTKPLEFGRLTIASSLQKLHIAGCLDRLPAWFGSMHNLTKLRLGLSQLSEDPFLVLKELPNLIFLQLYEAYKGRFMKCSNPGFNKLKILILTGLEELEEWVMEEGSMPCIQELWIMSCSALKMIPLGLEFLTTMQKLRLVSMPVDFTNRLSSSGGEDFTRVQHIPSVQVLEG